MPEHADDGFCGHGRKRCQRITAAQPASGGRFAAAGPAGGREIELSAGTTGYQDTGGAAR